MEAVTISFPVYVVVVLLLALAIAWLIERGDEE